MYHFYNELNMRIHLQVYLNFLGLNHMTIYHLKNYHLYIVFAENRDGLIKHCLEKGIDAKIHYPIPMYRQNALKYLGYKEGDFPVTDSHTKKIITFPCDQHLTKDQLDYIIDTVREALIHFSK